MNWEELDSAIFSDGCTRDIWNEILRVSPLDVAIFQQQSLNAPHEWQRVLMNWAVFVSKYRLVKDNELCKELNECGQFAWRNFLKICNRESDSTCAEWNPYKSV